MQCTSIHNVGVDTVFQGCESGNDSEGVSDKINTSYFILIVFIITFGLLLNVSAYFS